MASCRTVHLWPYFHWFKLSRDHDVYCVYIEGRDGVVKVLLTKTIWRNWWRMRLVRIRKTWWMLLGKYSNSILWKNFKYGLVDTKIPQQKELWLFLDIFTAMFKIESRRYMAEILPIRHKTLSNESINQSKLKRRALCKENNNFNTLRTAKEIWYCEWRSD